MTGVLIIDKPRDWTSHDVVAKLRGVYHERRAGHSGTLDPMATGVLVVFFGRATRAVERCEQDDKEYEATLRLGMITDTQDTTGQTLEERPVEVTEDALTRVLARFTGPQEHIPPMYSAVKIGGKKLYELARKGQDVERKPRNITVHALELLSFDGRDARLRIVCSKGTYIRTLCHDIGEALGCGGCMAELCRTRAGRFSLHDSVRLEDVLSAADQTKLIRPVDSLFSHLPALTLGTKETIRCKNGGEIPNQAGDDGEYRVYGPDGEFLMLGRLSGGTLKNVKSFFEVS